MAEDDTDDVGSDRGAGGVIGSGDAIAAALAADAAKNDPAMAARVSAVLEQQVKMLRAQTRLIDLQSEDLRKEDRIRHWSLRVRHINDIMKVAFALSGAFILLVAAIGVAALIWNASQASGLIFEPLKAPPDFATRGLDGTVLAQELLDKMNALIARGDKFSFRSADTISGNWGDNSKVEIPDTGISIAELSRFLRQRLGHETTMSGELVHTASGIALTVRVGSGTGTTFAGRDGDIDRLLDQAAHELLAETQPYRYVWILYDEGRSAASIAPMAQNFAEAATDDDERLWLRSAAEQMLALAGEFRSSAAQSVGTIAFAPSNPWGYFDYSPPAWALGHLELSRSRIDHAKDLLVTGSLRDFRTAVVPFLLANCRSFVDDISGAYLDAVADDIEESRTGQFDFDVSGPGSVANDFALDHDVGAARAALAQHSKVNDVLLMNPEYITTTGPALPQFFIAADTDDWRAARESIERTDLAAGNRHDMGDVEKSLLWPWLAYADARTGGLEKAQDLIAKTPLDCTLCLEMRGRIAELSGDDRGAIAWYGRAIADAPSIPFSYTDWGKLLMRQGDLDGAIRKFQVANQKSPHYADAIELWGEALMLENRSDLALAKFADAKKYAPHWGRLHLEWSKALYYAGHKDEARTQATTASGLELSSADRTALSNWMQRVH